MEELAFGILALAGLAPNQTWAKAECPSGRSARVIDTGWLPELGGGRVTMFWAASAAPCGACGGLPAFEDVNFTARLVQFHASGGSSGDGSSSPALQQQNQQRPFAVVFNSGLHDLCGSTGLLRTFSARLRTAVHVVINATRAPHFVWKTSNTKTGGYACVGQSSFNVGDAAVKHLNTLGTQTAADAVAEANAPAAALSPRPRMPTSFSVLDEHAIMLPLYEIEEVHQHHCSAWFWPGKPIRTRAHMKSACVATVAALVHILAMQAAALIPVL